MTELTASVASGPLNPGPGYFVTVTFPREPSDKEQRAVSQAANRLSGDILRLGEVKAEGRKVTFEVCVRDGHPPTESGRAQFNEAGHYFRTAWLQEALDSIGDGTYFIFY